MKINTKRITLALAAMMALAAVTAMVVTADDSDADNVLFQGVDYSAQRWVVTKDLTLIVTGNDIWTINGTGSRISEIQHEWILYHFDSNTYQYWEYYDKTEYYSASIYYDTSTSKFEMQFGTQTTSWTSDQFDLPPMTRDPFAVMQGIVFHDDIAPTDKITVTSFTSVGGMVNMPYFNAFNYHNFDFYWYNGKTSVTVPIHELRFLHADCFRMNDWLGAYDGCIIDFIGVGCITTYGTLEDFKNTECPFYDLTGNMYVDPTKLAGKRFVGESKWETYTWWGGTETYETYGSWYEVERTDEPGGGTDTDNGKSANWILLGIGVIVLIAGIALWRFQPMIGIIVICVGVAAIGIIIGWYFL